RVGILDQHRLNRWSTLQGFGIAGQDASDPGLIEPAGRTVDSVMALDNGFVELPDRHIVEEGTATFVLPGSRHRRDAQRRMHLRRTVAAAGEAVAEAEEGTFGLADQARERLDLLDRYTRDLRGPFRRTGRQMRFEFVGTIGVAIHIGAIRISLAEQNMHDAAGKGAIGA